MIKVSVIIPVYKVEAYIEKCVRSLFEQSLDDIEYIFVDDASPDRSIDILNELLESYPDRKKHCRIIHHETNRGLPQARKTGVSFATGEYIAHCDSDDWVDSRLYEAMYKMAKSNDSDLVVCQYTVVGNDGYIVREGTQITDVVDYLNSMLFYKDSFAMWNKMIRRSIYKDISFPIYNMGEDMATMFQLVNKCHSMQRVNGIYYYYNGTTPSISRDLSKEKIMQRAREACENVEFVVRDLGQNSYYDKGIAYLKYKQRIHLMPIINDKDAYSMWKYTFPEINKYVLCDSEVGVSFVDKLKFAMTLIGIFPLIKKYFRSNIC